MAVIFDDVTRDVRHASSATSTSNSHATLDVAERVMWRKGRMEERKRDCIVCRVSSEMRFEFSVGHHDVERLLHELDVVVIDREALAVGQL